jgi:RsiW-degrading membrane proteinase PrsW (M82 family)
MSETTVRGDIFSMNLHKTSPRGTSGKSKFYALLAGAVALSVMALIIGASDSLLLFFGAAAFLAASVYLFLVVHWYDSPQFSTRLSVMTFLVCGAISIAVALVVNFIVMSIAMPMAIEKVETGWWFWKETHIRYKDNLWMVLAGRGAFAGVTEELIKLGALLVVAPVRKAMKDRRSALYYATLCAAGFAMIENMQYFHSANSILILRFNPAHLVFSSLWGAAYGSWIAGNKHFGHFLKYLAYGMGLHAIWNLCPFVGSFGGPAVQVALLLIMVGTTMWLGIGFIKRELSKGRPS